MHLHLGVPVDRIEGAGPSITVVAGATAIAADLVVMAVGVSPRSELAAATGLELDDGAIPVDASMQTAAGRPARRR